MTNDELTVVITLIEGEFARNMRNTPSKLISLIKKEFDTVVSEETILNYYGLNEDYESQSKRIEYGYC